MEMKPGKVMVGHQRRSFDCRLWSDMALERSNQRSLLCLSASEDGTVKLWEVRSGKCEYTFKHSKDSGAQACFIEGARVLCVWSGWKGSGVERGR